MEQEATPLTEPLIRVTRDQETDHYHNHDAKPDHDLEEIKNFKQFLKEAKEENKRIWRL
jgi:hypothetical protein